MLPRAARLRKEREFRAVFSRSQSPNSTASPRYSRARVQSSSVLTVHLRPPRHTASSSDPAERGSGTPRLRFGFSISKKTAKRAHDRNRVKRRLSEITRRVVLPAYRSDQRFDCVIVARKPAVEADYAALQSDLIRLLTRAGIELEIEPAENATVAAEPLVQESGACGTLL